jgi:hypothetical protein
MTLLLLVFLMSIRIHHDLLAGVRRIGILPSSVSARRTLRHRKASGSRRWRRSVFGRCRSGTSHRDKHLPTARMRCDTHNRSRRRLNSEGPLFSFFPPSLQGSAPEPEVFSRLTFGVDCGLDRRKGVYAHFPLRIHACFLVWARLSV